MASTSDADTVRRLIYGGSTRSGTLSTADVDWYVDAEPNVYLAGAEAAAAEASVNADLAEKAVGDLRIRYGETARGWDAVYRRLRRRGLRKVKAHSGGISVAGKDTAYSDSDWDQPASRLGVHDFDNSTGGSTWYG